MADKRTDKQELNRIRAKVNHGGSYSAIVESVHTWDVAAIFEDFRAVIQIARRAIKANENHND
jgi:hypothetical protein